MTVAITPAQIDQLTDRLWAARTARGLRVDMRGAFVAHRANPADGMIAQLRGSVRSGGRVHPAFRASGTVTGRMTASGPNVQGLSAGFRGAFHADPGEVLISCDLDHVEPSVAAALSGDPGLMAACSPGSDPYLELASTLAGAVVLPGDPRRKVAKVVLLSLIYGKGAASLAADLDMTEARAREVRGQVLETFPVLAAWSAGLRATAEARGRLLTSFGRDVSDVGKVGGDRASYRATNYVVQGSAADHFKLAVLNVDSALTAAGMPGALWLPIHDELVISVPPDRAVEAAVILEAGMSAPFLGFPISGSARVLGERFGK